MILVLAETQVPSSRVHRFLHLTHFDKIISFEANGFVGGLWVLWNSNEVHLEPIFVHSQIINLIVKIHGQIP